MNQNPSEMTNKKKGGEVFDLEYYQKGFLIDYELMSDEIINMKINLNTYKSEVSKLSEFLEAIKVHEDNYKKLSSKFTQLETILEETSKVEKLIVQLSNNQQIINISEYVAIRNST